MKKLLTSLVFAAVLVVAAPADAFPLEVLRSRGGMERCILHFFVGGASRQQAYEICEQVLG